MLHDLITNLNTYLTLILAYGFSVTVAGAAKAWIAKKMGDYTADYAGYLTLDPLVHVDLMGMMVLLFTGIGWGRNIPVDVDNIQEPRRGAKLLTLFYSSALIHILLCVVAILLSEILSNMFGQGYFTTTIFGKILISVLKSVVQVNLFLGMLRFIQASMDLIFMQLIELRPEYGLYVEMGSLIGSLMLMYFLGSQIVSLFYKIAFVLSEIAVILSALLSSIILKLFAWM